MQAKSLLRAMKGSSDMPSDDLQDVSAKGERHPVVDRSMGDLIREVRNLDHLQIEEIVAYQRQHRMRFGEAAVALKMASKGDVQWALSQQFHYPYAAEGDTSGLDDELITAIDPFSDEAEVFRDVRSQLLMGVMSPDQAPRALAVLSPNIGDGKTFIAANLAVVFSQTGGRTLLIDADMRTPRLHTLFGVKDGSGLSDILAGRAEYDVIHQTPALPGLFVLPVGTQPPNPSELIQRATFNALIQEVCSRFDHVIVDTPAFALGADARVLAAKCGAAMVVGRRGTSRMDAIQSLVGQVNKSHARFAGVMINEH
ncbi:MAG: polysaccharide biosynthesis tyrosine autokinase [Burkholderiales bacterium]|nr:polysaccharide biosynthesis tyrosine autokinase [Burkholderiales bacterium]